MDAGMVGRVTEGRYLELVAKARELVELASRCQFALGDTALEIEPIQQHGGQGHSPVEKTVGVTDVLRFFADDIGVPVKTLMTYRWVASRWPAERRRKHVSHYIHRILASITDDDERWEAIDSPPLDERTGRHRWTEDAARTRIGQPTRTPTTTAQKIRAIHDLADDDEVASQATAELLRRPAVARTAMTDQTARHLVNRAQQHLDHVAAEPVRRVAEPALRRVDHMMGYIDLIGACASFVAAGGRIVPTLRGRSFSEDERTRIHKNLTRVRTTADWMENAVDTGNTSLDEGLAALLRDQQ
jgi:hypothetical protein